MSSCTLTYLGFHKLAWVGHKHSQPIACDTTCSRGTHSLQTQLSSLTHCLHSAPIAPLRTQSFQHLCQAACGLFKLHGQPSCMPVHQHVQCLGSMTKQLQAASYYCDVCVCKHMEYLLHVAPHACHPASIVQMVKSVFGVQGTV